ncbi:MAG: GDP-L-fucose synthase [Candidatus Marinimicrobia bacterium]|jgi:GDP-L-fucose synthase|nr:GDP-L-fucose synthase [Candidatus Neomarinimicrobiota bacterium]MBT3847588.1 GDP-L-fucose synthase [Candidatus Neomarinimicrobiota bacterium]MBT4053856.1 GDP-L-fucose synthase [Candidatus Neomarinimicrobiota bacterium]MBT4369070.1 GDP-L-fucose synthase [Candidatus Neomarinimicrobiota bacterium]MBT4662319.1 GDP-L-fucose synthase [Candidatus Neomarinimicrobiota bacterium]
MTKSLSPDSLRLTSSSKIYIAGHNGMVGSAIWRYLQAKGYINLIGKSSKELDLRNQLAVAEYFEQEKPEYVFLAAAKVGGIMANDIYRAEFIYNNLQIQNNIIHHSYISGVKKLLFLGSSCIYPRNCPQPMKEEYLLTGELELTNEPYAIAKIAGIKMCENYYNQYRSNFISVMPTNLYGPNDNYDLETSHVLPALIRKIYLGKSLENNDWDAIRSDLNKNPIKGIDGSASIDEIIEILNKNGFLFEFNNTSFIIDSSSVRITLWGTGKSLREFLHVDDLAGACTFLMEELDSDELIDENISHLNVGSGEEITIRNLAELVQETIGYKGKLEFDEEKSDGTPRKLLDSTRLNAKGWDRSISLEDGLISAYNWFKEHHN